MPEIPANPFGELGQTGLRRQGGLVFEDPLRQLQGQQGRKIYREMQDNDPVIGALLFTIDMLMRQVKWDIVPHTKTDPAGNELDPTPEDVAEAEFVDSCLKDLNKPFKEVVSEILSMLTFGWAYHEIVFKFRQGVGGEKSSRFTDNRIGWDRFAPRNQETLREWKFEPNGDVVGWIQQAEPDFIDRMQPLSKGLLFRTTTRNDNPEGRSILRNAYRAWYIKKNIENIQAIGIERDLAGLPMIGMPPEYLTEDADDNKKALVENMKKLLRNIRRDEQEGILVPLMYDENGNKLFELELMTTGGRRQFDTKGIIQYYDSRIAMTAMADFILLGHEIHGSFSLSDNKTELLTTALAAYMDLIADQFNRKAIPQLLMINGMDVETTPQLVHGDIETMDLGQLGTYIQQLGGAEVLTPDPNLENYLRRQASIPEKEGSV